MASDLNTFNSLKGHLQNVYVANLWLTDYKYFRRMGDSVFFRFHSKTNYV